MTEPLRIAADDAEGVTVIGAHASRRQGTHCHNGGRDRREPEGHRARISAKRYRPQP